MILGLGKSMKSETDFITNSNISKAIFIVLLLFSIHFWDLRYISQKYNAENVITWLVCGFSFLMVSQKRNLKFKNAILLFLIGILINIIPAYINHGQSPYDTILSFTFEYFILLYFLLHYFNLSRKFLENIIIIFASIYSIIYIIQVEVYPYTIVKNPLYLDKGEFQFAILGHGFLMLAYFLMLNRYLLNRQLKNIIMAIVFFIVLLMCDYRTLIAGAILITLIMLIKIVRFNAKDFAILIFVSLLFLGLFQFRVASKILERSVSETKSNFNEGDNYVRLRQFKFFFKEYPKNISYYIIGGGKPGGKSIYNYKMGSLRSNYNIVWVDLGILGFYLIIGGIALSGLLWYTVKAIFIKLPRDKLYLNFYFLYLLIVSFTNQEIYSDGIFTVQAIGLYLIDISVNEKSKSGDDTTIKKLSYQIKNNVWLHPH